MQISSRAPSGLDFSTLRYVFWRKKKGDDVGSICHRFASCLLDMFIFVLAKRGGGIAALRRVGYMKIITDRL